MRTDRSPDADAASVVFVLEPTLPVRRATSSFFEPYLASVSVMKIFDNKTNIIESDFTSCIAVKPLYIFIANQSISTVFGAKTHLSPSLTSPSRRGANFGACPERNSS